MSEETPAAKPSQPRLFPRHGEPVWRSTEIIGRKPDLVHDFYYLLIAKSWRVLLTAFVVAFLGTNALFGGLYAIFGGVENARPGSFVDGFFFSVETMGTIGYGEMTPHSNLAHGLVTVEAMLSLLGVAVVTGLVFAKFSRPQARVIFSDVAVVSPRNGVPTLMFRVANERANHIAEAQLRATLMGMEVTLEGERLRRMTDLPLVRNQSSAFILTWTAMHVINAQSPLFGATPELLRQQQAEILISFTGFDATLSQTIHARHSYIADEIHWNARFVDVLRTLPDGRRQVDYSKFHDTEPLPEALLQTASTGTGGPS